MNSAHPNLHSRFYLPLVFLWGALLIGRFGPAISQSVIQFEPLLQRHDLMIMGSARDVAVDDLVLYSFSPRDLDYVALVVGLPGDTIAYDFGGSSISRNGQRVIDVPFGYQLSYVGQSERTLDADEYAVYVHDTPRPPLSAVIREADIRGVVARVYRYSELRRVDWLVIALSSVLVLALVCLPFVDYAQHRPNGRVRLGMLVIHAAFSVVLLAAAVVLAVPGNPLSVGFGQPIWWWIPLAVLASWDAKVLAAGIVLLGLQLFVVSFGSGKSKSSPLAGSVTHR